MVEQIMMGRAPLPQHGSPWGDNSYGSSSISPIRAHIPEFATPPHHIDGGGGQGCPAHRAHTPEYGSPPTPIRLSPSPIAMSGGCPPTKCLKTPEDLFNGSMSDNSAGPDQGLLTHPYHRSPPTVRSHTSMTRRPGAASPEEDARHAISRAAVLYETTPKGRRFALEADSLTTMVVTAFDVAQAASTGRAGAASVPLGNFPPSLAVGGPRRRTSMVMKPPDSREMEDGQLMSRAVGDKMGSWRERLSHVEDVLKGQGGVLHAAKMAVAHLSEELAPRCRLANCLLVLLSFSVIGGLSRVLSGAGHGGVQATLRREGLRHALLEAWRAGVGEVSTLSHGDLCKPRLAGTRRCFATGSGGTGGGGCPPPQLQPTSRRARALLPGMLRASRRHEHPLRVYNFLLRGLGATDPRFRERREACK